MGTGYCLICSSPEVKVNPCGETGNDPNLTCLEDVEISTQVIFLLLKLLHLPSSLCEELVTAHGHPSTWIDLCDPCSILVRRGRDLYQEMSRLESEFTSLQATLRYNLEVKREGQEDKEDDFLDGGDTATNKILTFLLTSEEDPPPFVIVDDNSAVEEELEELRRSRTKKREKRLRKGQSQGKCQTKRSKLSFKINRNLNLAKDGDGDGTAARRIAETMTNYIKKKGIVEMKISEEEQDKDKGPMTGGQGQGSMLHSDRPQGKEEVCGVGKEKMMIMGEEILPEEEQEIEIPLFPSSPELGESDPFGSSESEYCGESSRVELEGVKRRKSTRNANFKRKNSDHSDDFFSEEDQEIDRESDDDDEYEPEYTRGRARGGPKKLSDPIPINKRDKCARQQGKIKDNEGTQSSGQSLVKKGDKKVHDIEIPVQPNWTWTDFVEWRTSRLLELEQGQPRTMDQNQMSPPSIVPSLLWLAEKYSIDKFPCPHCGVVFHFLNTWEKHDTKRCANPGPYRCWFDGCVANYMEYRNLEIHFRSCHLPEADLTCAGCGVCCVQIKDFNDHINNECQGQSPAEKGQDQSKCEEGQSNTVEGQRQAEKGSPLCIEKALTCKKCQKTNYFPSQSVLDIHDRIKHIPMEELPFPCTVPGCGKRFWSRVTLASHTKIVHPPNPEDLALSFMCDQCGATFKNERNMESHIQKVHLSRLPGAARFPCDICGKEMIDTTKLRRHKQIHIRPEDAPHSCTLCGKRFRLKEYLNIHMRSHDPERHLKYPHYMPNKKKNPERTGVAGAKIGRPKVKVSPPGRESSTMDKGSTRKKGGRKTRTKRTRNETLSTPEESSEG